MLQRSPCSRPPGLPSMGRSNRRTTGNRGRGDGRLVVRADGPGTGRTTAYDKFLGLYGGLLGDSFFSHTTLMSYLIGIFSLFVFAFKPTDVPNALESITISTSIFEQIAKDQKTFY